MDPVFFYPDCGTAPHYIRTCQQNCWEAS